MRRRTAWWVLAVGIGAWALALSRGWLDGQPQKSAHRAHVSAGGHFDPREVPIVVDVYEYGFTPSNVVIKAGHAVAWKDVGKEHHRIEPSTPAGRPVWIEARRVGSAAHVFRRPGVYPYHCGIHPWMRGTVTVRRRI